MKMTFLLKDLDEIISILYDLDFENNYHEISVNDCANDKILIDSFRIVIEELGVCVRQGEYYAYDESDHEYLADYSLSLLYPLNETNPALYLMFEQDSPEITLYNYFSHCGITLEQIENSLCYILLD